MNLSFDVITKEGDKIIVSLTSFYPYIVQLIGDRFPQLEIVEITIIREAGNGPINIDVFGKIAQVLISIAKDNPNTVLYYFCDITEEIPYQRAGKEQTYQEYRNNLFKLLFQRYRTIAGDHWSDIEIEMKSTQPLQTYYAHFLLRDQHIPLVQILRNEVLSNFKSISEQK